MGPELLPVDILHFLDAACPKVLIIEADHGPLLWEPPSEPYADLEDGALVARVVGLRCHEPLLVVLGDAALVRDIAIVVLLVARDVDGHIPLPHGLSVCHIDVLQRLHLEFKVLLKEHLLQLEVCVLDDR